MKEPPEMERANPEAVKQKSTWLNVQLLWGCDAWNVTPEQAAKQIVTDLYEHLSRGGTVPVRIEDLDGSTLEVAATVR